MAGSRQASRSHTRLLRALAAGSSLSFSIALVWLAPAGATPSHSKTPKPGNGHSTPVTTPVVAAAPVQANVPAAAVAAPAPAGAAAGATKRPARHAAKHSAPGAAKNRHTPSAAGAGGAHGRSEVSASSGEGAGSQNAIAPTGAATHEKLKVTHGTTRGAKAGRRTPASKITTVAGEAAATAARTTAVMSAPAPATAASTAATPPPATAATPTTGTTRRRAGTHRRAAHRAAKPAPAGAVSGVLPFTAATPAEGLGGRASAATGSGAEAQGSTTRQRPRPHAESPIVTTVTKIISVVPPVWRWLIGALLALAAGLAVVSQVAAVRARRLARQRRELLDDVGLLQAALLPPLPRKLGPVGTSAAYRPASGPGAGGDFYDVFGLGDGRLAVIVGDVSGHGRHALPRTTLVRFTLRAYLEAGMQPRAALQMAGPVLERQLGDAFATVVLATYDPGERRLVYASAGHPPPVVTGADTLSPVTVCSAPPLGVGSPTGTRQTTIAMPGAAVACFYTDGVIEARVQGQLFGSPRLERMVTELDGEATATTLLDHVSGVVDRRPDDMAACLLRFDGGTAAPAVALEELELDSRSAGRERVERFLLAAGLHPAVVESAAAAVRRAVAEHHRVVLELRYTDGIADFAVRPLDAGMLKAWRAQTARAEEMAG